MAELYRGKVIEESLENPRVLDETKILYTELTEDEDPADHWHIHVVEVTKEHIQKISAVLRSRGFYAHFWDGQKNVIVAFRDQLFEFNTDDEKGKQAAIEYGKTVGVPEEQLDFLTEESHGDSDEDNDKSGDDSDSSQ
jgi:hypothetical protein